MARRGREGASLGKSRSFLCRGTAAAPDRHRRRPAPRPGGRREPSWRRPALEPVRRCAKKDQKQPDSDDRITFQAGQRAISSETRRGCMSPTLHPCQQRRHLPVGHWPVRRDSRSRADLPSWLTRASGAPPARVWSTCRAAAVSVYSKISIERSWRNCSGSGG